MKTFVASASAIERKWYVVDAQGYTLGRLSSEIAKVLRGKNKVIFTPHLDTGDYVIVVNADKIHVTGKKLDQKIYYRHSEYVGGMKETVDAVKAAGLANKVKVMIGGAPVTEAFCAQIGADAYTPDAASAADKAVELLAN